jgi:hypothetical protein
MNAERLQREGFTRAHLSPLRTQPCSILHLRKCDASAILWAFDLLALNAKDLRRLPLAERKARLARLLKQSP